MKKVTVVSIKTKLLGIILPVIIVIIVVLTSLSYYVSKNVIKSNAQDLLKTSVESQVLEIEAWLNQNLISFSVGKQAIERMNFDEKQLQAFLDAYYGFDSNYPKGFYIADKNGRLLKGREVSESIETTAFRQPDEQGNYIENGDFAIAENLTDAEGWIFLTTLEGDAEAEIKEKELSISTKKEGTVDYSIQLVQPKLPIKKGGIYQVCFDAYASENRTMKTGVTAPDRDYQRYLEDTVVELTTEKQTFTYEFTMTSYDDTNGRLEFNLGLAGSTAEVKISNVSVKKIGTVEESNSDTEQNFIDTVNTEWFQSGLSRVNMGFTNAYENENGEQVISACGMLKSDSDDLRVISAELALDKVSVYVNSFVKMKDAESFLINTRDNMVLASRDTGLISKKLSDIEDDFMQTVAEKISNNILDLTEIDGNMSVFEKVEGTEWVLVSFVPTKTIYHDLERIRMITILFGIISVLALTVLIERIVHIVIHPVKKLTDVIRAMTNGDFTVHSNTKSRDEIGIMSQCVEKFINTMCGMIASIYNVSSKLHHQADNSKFVSSEMFHASEQQNQSMKALNTTVEQLSLSINGIAQSATTLANVVTETKDDSDHVNVKMKETVDISQKGKEAIEDVSSAMQDINTSVKKLQLAIDEVGKASEEITNITKVIGDIADETNLLSLNASIEAARAGEAGKGFAVVALEIGNLAQTSMNSVQNINDLILKIKTLIMDVIHQVNDSVENIHNSDILIGNAIKTFDVIFGNIVTVGNLVQNMIQKVEEVEDVAGNVAAISEEQAASSEEILNSSDILVEQANSLMVHSETVAKESVELTMSAEELAEQIKTFQIEEKKDAIKENI